MCGIAGLLKRADTLGALSECTAKRMCETLRHRGPDASGSWGDENIGMAHQRLSILDLSNAGHQPMMSPCKRFVLVFNGEIYNHSELRRELMQKTPELIWRGGSDTEVLLAAISAWGLESTLRRTRGMHALALWDRAQKKLSLSRDRIGEKPLYYGNVGGGGFAFASELRALREINGSQLTISAQASALMIQLGYVPAPYSIYEGVYKLPPGTILTVDALGRHGQPESWWALTDVIKSTMEHGAPRDEARAIDELESLLVSIVSEQMESDVPLGAMLSGGIDSSLVVALMQKLGTGRTKTFSIGFAERAFDESDQAKSVAEYLKTEHTQLKVSAEDALQVIPRLPDIYDEPFADSSQIPSVILSSLTREHVTVALTGDGGDEVFGGYNRHVWSNRMPLSLGFPLPWSIRLSARLASTCLHPLISGANRALGLHAPVRKLEKFVTGLSAQSSGEFYGSLVSQWKGQLPVFVNAARSRSILAFDSSCWPITETMAEQFMAVDTLTYLPDDILVKVDRASMASSLETRTPYLDSRLIEFAWALPLSQKIRGNQGKWLLRRLLDRYVPRALVERPKQGFGIPLGAWLRGPLRGWAEALLSENSLKEGGLINSACVRDAWRSHLAGSNNEHGLWTVLMYLSWRERWA